RKNGCIENKQAYDFFRCSQRPVQTLIVGDAQIAPEPYYINTIQACVILEVMKILVFYLCLHRE
ncbi:MAG TPA: hypothetical protein PLA77_07695, partial [Bacteroidales bacterium]|nr:hypothetical protein [Bacteroidales bacterium]